MFLPGAQIGRFRLEAEIGRGGMGVVYRALDPVLNRPVALKILAPHMAGDKSAPARFHREAAAAANLKHPHIATVYEFGEYEGRSYIAFEWIEGRTLKTIIDAEGRLPLDRALRLFDQLADALDYAHRHGVVHRDIKPANIVVGPGDHAAIVDFGLAWLANTPALTTSGSVFGTPRYMSPEQVMGKRLDGRSDQYSLAVTLYEMLAGRPPFDAPTPHALLHHQVYTPPPPITELNPGLPPEVDAALMTALAKDPSQRFPNVSAFATALRAGSAPAVELTRRPSGMHLPPAGNTRLPEAAASIASGKHPTRRRLGWLIGLTAFVCLGLFAALGLPRLFAGSGAPSATATTGASERPSPAETLIASPSIVPSQTDAALVTPPAPFVPPLEGGLWPMFAGDAAQTGFVGEGMAALNPAPQWVSDPIPNAGTALVLGRGRVVLGATDGTLRALDWASGIPIWELPLGSKVIGAPVIYASDESALVFAALENGELYALNLSDGGYIWSKSGEEMGGTAYGLTVGSDGVLYAATDTGWLQAFSPLTGEVYWSLDLTQSDSIYAPPAITGAGIFLSSAYQTLTAINPATLETMWRAETLGFAYTPPSAAEGLGAVFIGTNRGWVYAFSMTDGSQWWSAQVSGPIAGIANDGARLFAATSNGSVYAWDAVTGEALWALNTGNTINAPPLTDGVSVLVGTYAGNALTIDAASGVEFPERRLTVGGPILSMAPAGGWLFLWTGGNIYGFGP
jgi:outer membrane protein assembly factor BamB